jgi:hypothetical protein
VHVVTRIGITDRSMNKILIDQISEVVWSSGRFMACPSNSPACTRLLADAIFHPPSFIVSDGERVGAYAPMFRIEFPTETCISNKHTRVSM